MSKLSVLNPDPTKSQSGFSPIEVLVGFAILGIIILVAGSHLVNSAKVQKRSKLSSQWRSLGQNISSEIVDVEQCEELFKGEIHTSGSQINYFKNSTPILSNSNLREMYTRGKLKIKAIELVPIRDDVLPYIGFLRVYPEYDQSAIKEGRKIRKLRPLEIDIQYYKKVDKISNCSALTTVVEDMIAAGSEFKDHNGGDTEILEETSAKGRDIKVDTNKVYISAPGLTTIKTSVVSLADYDADTVVKSLFIKSQIIVKDYENGTETVCQTSDIEKNDMNNKAVATLASECQVTLDPGNYKFIVLADTWDDKPDDDETPIFNGVSISFTTKPL